MYLCVSSFLEHIEILSAASIIPAKRHGVVAVSTGLQMKCCVVLFRYGFRYQLHRAPPGVMQVISTPPEQNALHALWGGADFEGN